MLLLTRIMQTLFFNKHLIYFNMGGKWDHFMSNTFRVRFTQLNTQEHAAVTP